MDNVSQTYMEMRSATPEPFNSSLPQMVINQTLFNLFIDLAYKYEYSNYKHKFRYFIYPIYYIVLINFKIISYICNLNIY